MGGTRNFIGGWGAKDYVPARTLRAPNRTRQGPGPGPGSSRVVLVLLPAISALFLSILIIKKNGLKNPVVDPILGGACCAPPPPPLDPPHVNKTFIELNTFTLNPPFKQFTFLANYAQNYNYYYWYVVHNEARTHGDVPGSITPSPLSDPKNRNLVVLFNIF